MNQGATECSNRRVQADPFPLRPLPARTVPVENAYPRNPLAARIGQRSN
jgi:hypothetical protein